MSPALLSQRLQQPEHEGIIERRPVPSRGTHEYRLTEAGRALAPVVRHLGEWGEQWALGDLDERDLDVTLLMWAMRRRVDPAAFGSRRAVVAFDYTDVPQAKRYWWLVNNGKEVELCPKDPGFEVDLHVTVDLQIMVKIWVGALPLNSALRNGLLELSGMRELQQQFKSWLLLSPFVSAGARKSH